MIAGLSNAHSGAAEYSMVFRSPNRTSHPPCRRRADLESPPIFVHRGKLRTGSKLNSDRDAAFKKTLTAGPGPRHLAGDLSPPDILIFAAGSVADQRRSEDRKARWRS